MTDFDRAWGLGMNEGLRPGEHPYNLRRAQEHFECGYLRNILVLTDWELEPAAEMLGVSVNTLQEKVKKYHLMTT